VLDVSGAPRFVLVDGVFVPHLSEAGALEAGVTLRQLGTVLNDAGNAARADLLRTNATNDACWRSTRRSRPTV